MLYPTELQARFRTMPYQPEPALSKAVSTPGATATGGREIKEGRNTFARVHELAMG